MRFEWRALTSQRSMVRSAASCAEMKRILDASCIDCFRRKRKSWASSGRKNTTASPPRIPFFVPPKERTSTPRSRVAWRRVWPSAPAAFEMQVHVALMGEVGESMNFAGLVDGAHFRGLGNGNDLRLDVMFVANAVVGVAHHFDVEL